MATGLDSRSVKQQLFQLSFKNLDTISNFIQVLPK